MSNFIACMNKVATGAKRVKAHEQIAKAAALAGQ